MEGAGQAVREASELPARFLKEQESRQRRGGEDGEGGGCQTHRTRRVADFATAVGTAFRLVDDRSLGEDMTHIE